MRITKINLNNLMQLEEDYPKEARNVSECRDTDMALYLLALKINSLIDKVEKMEGTIERIEGKVYTCV